MTGKLNWFTGGIALGLVFFITVLVIKPIGVSTQFVILDGIVWNAVSSDLVIENPDAKSGYSSSNAYLDKSGGKYAKSVAEPANYSFVFVLFMAVGAFLSLITKGPKPVGLDRIGPMVWRNRFGEKSCKRYAVVFIGGILVLFGSRLAGGCTSGHMMSGMMQTSLSGYLFAAGAFAMGIPVAIMMYNCRKEAK